MARVGQFVAGLLCGALLPLPAAEFAWPTSMPAELTRDPADYLQPTVSGRSESATFGMVREEGKRFHEGVDIRPHGRDAAGEPTDRVLAAMEGLVAYVNPKVNGPYGRYVVLHHPGAEASGYTLYAHLASILPELRPGQKVARGQILGVMGRSSAGADPITPDRAHLHFEVGVMLSNAFNRWYDSQPENKGDPNPHGIWNGHNLMGMDPTPFLARRQADLPAAIRAQPAALAVVMRTARIPDFVKRHPGLVNGRNAVAAGWRVEFTWQGMPKAWTPLADDDQQLPRGSWNVVAVDYKVKDLLVQRKMLLPDGRRAGEILRRNVEILLSGSR